MNFIISVYITHRSRGSSLVLADLNANWFYSSVRILTVPLNTSRNWWWWRKARFPFLKSHSVKLLFLSVPGHSKLSELLPLLDNFLKPCAHVWSRFFWWFSTMGISIVALQMVLNGALMLLEPQMTSSPHPGLSHGAQLLQDLLPIVFLSPFSFS